MLHVLTQCSERSKFETYLANTEGLPHLETVKNNPGAADGVMAVGNRCRQGPEPSTEQEFACRRSRHRAVAHGADTLWKRATHRDGRTPTVARMPLARQIMNGIQPDAAHGRVYTGSARLA
jgi:hypothetical protein